MATARCYTKSGSVEKYERDLFSGAVNHYPHSFITNLIGPDSNGNYSISYNGYDDGTSDNYVCYCKTMYGDWGNGGGVSKIFYFKDKIHFINLSCGIHLSGSGDSIQILLKFDNNKYLGNDKLSVEVTVYTISPSGVLGTVIDSGFFTVTKYSISPLRYYIDLGAEVGKKYVARITRCSPASGDGYIVKY